MAKKPWASDNWNYIATFFAVGVLSIAAGLTIGGMVAGKHGTAMAWIAWAGMFLQLIGICWAAGGVHWRDEKNQEAKPKRFSEHLMQAVAENFDVTSKIKMDRLAKSDLPERDLLRARIARASQSEQYRKTSRERSKEAEDLELAGLRIEKRTAAQALVLVISGMMLQLTATLPVLQP